MDAKTIIWKFGAGNRKIVRFQSIILWITDYLQGGKLTFTMEKSGGDHFNQEIKFTFINNGISWHYVPSVLK